MSTQDTATLIVDGEHLLRAPHHVMGRGPDRHQRIDYRRLLAFTAREAFGAPRQVQPIFVQRERPNARPFFACVRDKGYELRLHGGRSWHDQADMLMELLHELRGRGGDLLFAGGDDYAGNITRMVHDLATEADRDVVVAHYDYLRSIDCGHVRYRSLAADIGAMRPPVPAPYASDCESEDDDDGGWTVRRFPTGFEDPGPFGSARWN